MPDHEAKQIIEQFEQLESDRGFWESHWEDVARYVLPTDRFMTKMVGGTERHRGIFEDTAVENAEFLASMLSGLLTNPQLYWFELSDADQQRDPGGDFRSWLRLMRNTVMDRFNSPLSGFYQNIDEAYLDLVAFGTAVIFAPRDKASGLRFQTLPLNECYLREDARKQVDAVFRRFKFTIRQAIEAFGIENLSEKTRNMAKQAKKHSEQIEFVHAVVPRSDRDPFSKRATDMPWASVYVERANKHIVQVGGFQDFPYLTPRWVKASGEVYGRSPAMKVLPSIRMANAMMKTTLIAGQKVADPPLQMPDDGFLGPLRTQPGGINYYRAGTQDRAEPLITGAQPQMAFELVQATVARIDRAFFRDILELPQLDRMTAEEVRTRRGERMQLMSPTVGRLQGELLSPAVNRMVRETRRAELIDAPPEGLANIEIEYVSPLARSQKASEVDSLFQLMGAAAQAAQFDPEAADVLDSDGMMRELADMLHVTPRALRSSQEVQQRRQERQEMMRQQQEAQTMREAAAGMKDAASAGRELGV